MDEIASKTLDASIIKASYEAAKEYPLLRILCPWCGTSILGSDFQAHGELHENAIEIPSSWLAL